MKQAQSKADIIRQYTPFAMRFAHKQRRKEPAWRWPEIRQSAMVGLWDATERHDPGQGSTFTTYAKFRIHGAIVDYLRESMYFNRRVHERNEITVFNPTQEEGVLHGAHFDKCDDQIMLRQIIDVIDTLPDRQRDAITAHISGEPYSELASKYGVNETRISQYKNDAIKMIREKLGVTDDFIA